ncbi:hypothetical protein PMKS-001951 [Pichia membranifaciens]|uniref:Uncharacterized protein n=1 Tax=Pichia membranifaciens TaxID=4926 RepID=A0A1Q2YFY2_9ASCO|nr:hypothetical protein PMKS-001951 [Pichia membranifaciens]
MEAQKVPTADIFSIAPSGKDKEQEHRNMQHQKQAVERVALENLLADKPPVHSPFVHELTTKVKSVFDKVLPYCFFLGEKLEVDSKLNNNTEKYHTKQLD